MMKDTNEAPGKAKVGLEKAAGPGRNAKDITAKRFFRRPEIAADICNALVFGGRQVVRPSDMKEAPTELPLVAFTPDGECAASTRLRDIVHHCATYVNKDITCIYLCLEIQSTQDRVMVLRVLEQILRHYVKQVDTGDFKRANGTLAPVLGFLINFSDRPWSSPLEFVELFGELPEEYRPFIPQFRLALIDPYTIGKEKCPPFNTEIKTVVYSFCFSNDAVRLVETLKNPPGGYLSREAADLLKAYRNINIPMGETQGRLEMCKGWDDYEQGLRNQGFEKGILQGKQEGMQAGMLLGKQEGITWMVSNMLAMNMPMEDIARASGLKQDEISRILTQMK